MGAFNQRPMYSLSHHALRLFHSLCRPSDHVSLAESVATLSRIFTKDRGDLHVRYLDDRALAAGYAAYFLPVNFAKIQMLLYELPGDWAGTESLSVLDVGSGPGTAALAVRDWLTERNPARSFSVRAAALDHSHPSLIEATRLWTLYGQRTGTEKDRLVTSTERLDQLSRAASSAITTQGPFDLILVANSLNELFQVSPRDASAALDQRMSLIERLLSVLKPQGTLVILEPALRFTARALHEIRDQVLERGLATVYSPCLHDRDCPALMKPDDWCHEERPWEPPSWITELDARVGFIKDALKFSYVMLRKDGRTIVPRRPDVYRVVSELRVFKGEKRAWLCNEQGRSEIGRLDRKASPSNGAFEAFHRGGLVQIDRIERKERGGTLSALGRIPEESTVSIVREAY
jgi:ribosomal protein RSM22 (predicted rRNA methylase)